MTKRDDMAVLERIFATGDATLQRSLRPVRSYSNQQTLWPRSIGFNVIIALWTVCVVFAFFYLDRPVAVAVKATVTRDTDIYYYFKIFTRLGEGLWLQLVTFAIFMALASLRWGRVAAKERFRLAQLHGAAFFTFATVTFIGTLVSIVKHTIGRARPSQLDLLGHYHSGFPVWDATFASFPSGHSTTFGASAMALALFFPSYRWAFALFGIAGAASRVIVSAHWVSDALAGLGIGALFVLLSARFLARRRTLLVFNKSIFPKLSPRRRTKKTSGWI